MHTPDKPRDDAPGDGEFNVERLVVVDGSKWKFSFRNLLHHRYLNIFIISY